MNLLEALKLVAPKLEGNMKVTKTDYSSYSVKCYGEDASGYMVLNATVEGNNESDFDIFNLKISINDIEEDLSFLELLEVYCNGSVDPSGVESLEVGHSMLFELS